MEKKNTISGAFRSRRVRTKTGPRPRSDPTHCGCEKFFRRKKTLQKLRMQKLMTRFFGFFRHFCWAKIYRIFSAICEFFFGDCPCVFSTFCSIALEFQSPVFIGIRIPNCSCKFQFVSVTCSGNRLRTRHMEMFANKSAKSFNRRIVGWGKMAG